MKQSEWNLLGNDYVHPRSTARAQKLPDTLSSTHEQPLFTCAHSWEKECKGMNKPSRQANQEITRDLHTNVETRRLPCQPMEQGIPSTKKLLRNPALPLKSRQLYIHRQIIPEPFKPSLPIYQYPSGQQQDIHQQTHHHARLCYRPRHRHHPVPGCGREDQHELRLRSRRDGHDAAALLLP